MPESLKNRAGSVVGARQVLRSLREGTVEAVFLALDAAPRIRQPIEEAARAAGVPLTTVSTMEELARLCRVGVPSAAAAIRRNEGAC